MTKSEIIKRTEELEKIVSRLKLNPAQNMLQIKRFESVISRAKAYIADEKKSSTTTCRPMIVWRTLNAERWYH